jgi:hypothetical protein
MEYNYYLFLESILVRQSKNNPYCLWFYLPHSNRKPQKEFQKDMQRELDFLDALKNEGDYCEHDIKSLSLQQAIECKKQIDESLKRHRHSKKAEEKAIKQETHNKKEENLSI